jgi:osmoprotectant transport system permease protein
MSWLDFLAAHQADLWWRTAEHLALCVTTLAVATAAAVPLGVALAGVPRLASAVLAASAIVQTVPSLALLGFLMVVTGRIGWVPSVIALLLYSLLPILRNVIVGLGQTPAPIRQAAVALGMTRSQILWQVDLPLAMPVVIAGLRTAAVWTVGTATLCAFIGAGGLGVFINRGIETIDPRLVLLGVVPTAAMALIADAIFHRVGRHLTPPGGT